MTNETGRKSALSRNYFRWSKRISKCTTNDEQINKIQNNEENVSSLKRSSSFVRKCLKVFEKINSNKSRKDDNIYVNAATRNENWPTDRIPGVIGLKNHGNTCFMNAVLQCLSHTDLLAEYFVLGQYKNDLKRRNKLNSRKFGTKGEVTEELANVLKALWMCSNEFDHSTSFKAAVDRYGAQFTSSTQHDAQEFLLWLMDKVHEDLNTATKRKYKSIKNNYGRSDEEIAAETLANHIRCNNSFVQTVFQAQFRSSLTCPQCKKQSNTFDPFHCISVQLPQLTQQVVFITVLYAKQHPRQVKLGLTVPAGSPISSVRQQLNSDTSIKTNQMILAEINDTGFSKIFYDYQPCSMLNQLESLYCIEMPDMKSLQHNNATTGMNLMLLIANLKISDGNKLIRFGMPYCVEVERDYSFSEVQKKILREMSSVLKPEVFSYKTPLQEMFRIRLQDPSADPDTYLENVDHPLFTEVIDAALSLISPDAGPPHIKLLLEWKHPEIFFIDLVDHVVEHETVQRLKISKPEYNLSLEQCLNHYTKAETLSLEDAWRCPHCQKYLPVVKKLGLWSLPDILVIHLKRFRQYQEKGPNAAKLTTMVKFPLYDFDMSPHLANKTYDFNKKDISQSSNTISWKKRKNKRPSNSQSQLNDHYTSYDLYAVCYHQGDTLETGHYTAACKNPLDQKWYRFDDQKVSNINPNKIEEEIVNNNAYILFYQRKTNKSCENKSTFTNTLDHWVNKLMYLPIAPETSIEKINESEEIFDESENNKEIDELIISESAISDNQELLPKANSNNSIYLKNEIDNNATVFVEVEVNDIKSLEKENFCSNVEIENKEESKIYADDIKSGSTTDDDESNSLQISTSSIPRNRTTSISHVKSQKYIKNVHSNYATITSSTGIKLREAFSQNLKSGVLVESCAKGSLNENSHCINLRHSFSTNSAISLLRSNTSSCSKDTLIFIDQHRGFLSGHGDDGILESRALWISPVTPHKLVSVSPKN